MSDQGDLFNTIDNWRIQFDDGTYPTDFWDWLADNQHILNDFVAIARRAKNLGFSKWSGRAVIEIMRWETAVKEGGQGTLKINNNCFPGLTRLTMKLHPDLKGFFATRHPPANVHGRRLIDGQFYGYDAHE